MDQYEVAIPQACAGLASHPPTAASSGLRRPLVFRDRTVIKSELTDANASDQRRHGSWMIVMGQGTDAMGEISSASTFYLPSAPPW